MNKIKILIGAGGTGGHLFPAVAVMERIAELRPDIEFIFTGRSDKIEGTLIPKMGLKFIPINVEGFSGLSINSLSIPFKIFKAKRTLSKLIKKESMKAVICTGAYISYAPGLAAKSNQIPLFLMESNVNPGKTISMLSGIANLIFTSFPNTTNFFNPKIQKKIIYSGNPLRKFFSKIVSKDEVNKSYNFENNRTLLVFGGSLGAKSINNAMENIIDDLLNLNINVIWQTGKNYQYKGATNRNLNVIQFIDDMNIAYTAADLVVSRSGATTVAELASLGKPSILVPLSSASNNEQFMNAKIFADKGAALLIEDTNLKFKLMDTIKKLIFDDDKLDKFASSAKNFAKDNAADIVAQNILNYLDNYGK